MWDPICVRTPSVSAIPARSSDRGDSGVSAKPWALVSNGMSLWVSLSRLVVSDRGGLGCNLSGFPIPVRSSDCEDLGVSAEPRVLVYEGLSFWVPPCRRTVSDQRNSNAATDPGFQEKIHIPSGAPIPTWPPD